MADQTELKDNQPKAEKKSPKKGDITTVKTSNTNKTKVTAQKSDKKPKIKRNKSKKIVQEGKAFIQSSYNNTLITITDLEGNVIAQSSAGANGFRGAKKATPYAAQISAEAAVNKALPYGLEKLHVFVKGVGTGRDQAIRGLYTSSGVNIESITDVTPVSHNGCRPKKARRM